MDFNEKLQTLRKQKGLTQEELAEALYVSRTAISKWESGRGFPSIESLKAISNLFSVSIDELLSGNQLISIAEEDTKQKKMLFCDLVFGLLDISILTFIFLPFFGQKSSEVIKTVSLLHLSEISLYLKMSYFAFIIASVLFGILTLALQNYHKPFWINYKNKISLFISIVGVLLFVVSLQPYASTLLIVFLTIKVLMLTKKG